MSEFEFRPSSVDTKATLSAFGAAEEVAAMYVVAYLAALSAAWDNKFLWEDFNQWLVDNPPSENNNPIGRINRRYRMMVNIRGVDLVNGGVATLILRGYLTCRSDDSEVPHLTVTSKFVDVMKQYTVTAV
jgi:hypothetical protein